MQSLLISRVSATWLGLVIATCVSWELFRGVGGLDGPKISGAAAVAIAFVKTRFILLDFMEMRHAPRPMRIFAECWWFGVGAIVLLTFWTAFFGL